MAEEGKPPGWRVEGSPKLPKDKKPRPRLGRRLLIFFGVLLVFNWLSVLVFAPGKTERVSIPYSPTFLQQVQAGNVKSISSKGETIQGDFRSQFKKNTRFDTEVPTFANTDQLSQLLEQHKVEINAKPVTSDRSLLATILLSFGPTLLFIGLLVMLMRRAQPGGLMASLGRSKARRGEDAEQRVTFADVAGIDEAEDELVEIVDFLKHPDKYRRLGAKIPRGVLLSGPPGTGKTLLARAVAGEAGVPFFSISASEFVEVIVGVGASRVRDLFKEAKEAAPAIIFIDELDAIGRARSTGPGISGGHDEREQTLNQILTEMDGFDPAAGVIVMGATNRPEILDPALLRPGRFDRRITVQPPDRNGRRQILEVHTRSVPLAEDVDLDRLASSTPGMVGADLANLVNEAALLAAKRGHDAVHQGDFLDAVEKIVLGTARKVMMSDADRERTAYHESGHAIVGMLTPGADPVRKVSIIPRGMSLGVTLSTPDADRFNYSREELVARIKVALGGRAAELVVYGDVTTGAESDIRQLTVIAKSMVTRWGMSEAVGPVFLDNENPYSPEAPNPAIDDEVRRIVEGAEEETVTLLRANRSRLDALVARLLEKETIDQDEVYEVVGPLADAAATPA
ncbi:MAG: cell division protease FtsH [Solirubrobacteraceae bacterium]|jgi:cell division protease FtsH|nr:cell division protease FtsH [Solirubrobacteraceae bacterium]